MICNIFNIYINNVKHCSIENYLYCFSCKTITSIIKSTDLMYIILHRQYIKVINILNMFSHKGMLNLLHFNFFINFVCVTSRLIDVVCMCVSNKVVKRKPRECLIFLPFRKMLSKKKHIADNFFS